MTNGVTTVTIVGNLTEDPTLRFTPSGVAVATFSVAVNRRQFDRQANAWKDGTTDYHRIVVWRSLAENCAESLQRGVRVVVVGDLKSRTYTDDKTNEKRTVWEVDATSVGPDLSFATAKVVKASRGQSAPVQGPPEPWQQ